MTDRNPDTARKTARRIPPLVWIVLALLVAWLVVAMMQRKGADHTPQGGSTPAQAEGTSTMPAAPASGDAPATPAGTINGPTQPAPQ
jgi:flagellar basal body-associated protein FliL